MNESPIRAGVVGVGQMGSNHARVYSELKGVELYGVSDADAEAAAKTADTYDTTALEIDALLEEVDVASIVVPTRFHHEVATQAIGHGTSILVEKPFVQDIDDGLDIIRRAAAADVTLQVGHIERFNPIIEVLQNILPDLDIIDVTARRLGPPVDRDSKDDVVMDLMIHDIDIVLSLLDRELESVTALGARKGRHVTAHLGFSGDVISRLTASRVTQEKVRELVITARECRVKADYIDQSIQIHRNSSPEYLTGQNGYRFKNESVIERPRVESAEPLKRELESFVEAHTTETTPTVTGEDGLNALHLAKRISDATTNRPQQQSGGSLDEFSEV